MSSAQTFHGNCNKKTKASLEKGHSHDNFASSGGGNVTLSGTLDRIRLTTTNGTDVFDGGSVNIVYE